MSSNLQGDDLSKLSREADELLQRLDTITDEAKPAPQPLKPRGKSFDESVADQSGSKEGEPSSGLQAGLLFAIILFVTLVAVVGSVVSGQNKTGTGPVNADRAPETSSSDNQGTIEMGQSAEESEKSASSQEVYFEGINLPITNKLCNRKNTFCIYGLARLVETEAGSASYSFVDSDNGQRVNIQGEITIASVERNANGTRTLSFSFRDNQSLTTSGWAASGSFVLDQDSKQAGILTRFKTTESYGPKTPIGLENTSYLFPS